MKAFWVFSIGLLFLSLPCRLSLADGPRESVLALSISPQLYSMNTDGYAGVFTGNGFSPPPALTVGLDLALTSRMPSLWEVGLLFGGTSAGAEMGSFEVDYQQQYLGFWLGKVIPVCGDFELTFGSGFSFGEATLEVFSANVNGRVDENSFLLQPKVLGSYRLGRWMKLGVSVSYNQPLSISDSVKGTGLSTGEISVHGYKAGFEFIIGQFGGQFGAQSAAQSGG